MKEFIWHEIQPRKQSMKRNIYIAALAALLCAAALVFTSRAQKGSSAKHAFTPDVIP
jgi:hypothetical protein